MELLISLKIPARIQYFHSVEPERAFSKQFFFSLQLHVHKINQDFETVGKAGVIVWIDWHVKGIKVENRGGDKEKRIV